MQESAIGGIVVKSDILEVPRGDTRITFGGSTPFRSGSVPVVTVSIVGADRATTLTNISVGIGTDVDANGFTIKVRGYPGNLGTPTVVSRLQVAWLAIGEQ